MAKAYRFDDQKPAIGSTPHAFRTLKGLKDFAQGQGPKGSQKFWEIQGVIISDDGTEDGIKIRVQSAREVH